jgi:hypothetical protein
MRAEPSMSDMAGIRFAFFVRSCRVAPLRERGSQRRELPIGPPCARVRPAGGRRLVQGHRAGMVRLRRRSHPCAWTFQVGRRMPRSNQKGVGVSAQARRLAALGLIRLFASMEGLCFSSNLGAIKVEIVH